MNSKAKNTISKLGILIWCITALFFFYDFFLRNIVGTLAEEIISDLNLNTEQFSLLGTAYFITYGIMQVPVGIIVDKIGVKKSMFFALLICIASCFFMSFAHGFTFAFISRLLMGAGTAFAFVCLLVVVMNWFPENLFGFFSGISQFVGTLGPLIAAGPLMSLLMSYHETWRDAMNTSAIFGIFLCILTLLFVKNKPREQWAYLEVERSVPLKILILNLLKNKQSWYVALYSAFIYTTIGILGAIWGTDYLNSKGFTDSQSAYLMSISWIGYAVGCPFLGLFSDLIQRRKTPMIISSILGFISICGIIFINSINFVLFAALFFILGFASSAQNIGFATIIEKVTLNLRSTALGLNNAVLTASTAIVPPLMSYIISFSTTAQKLSAHDFFYAFLVLPFLFLLSMIFSIIFISETYCKPQKSVIYLHDN